MNCILSFRINIRLCIATRLYIKQFSQLHSFPMARNLPKPLYSTILIFAILLHTLYFIISSHNPLVSLSKTLMSCMISSKLRSCTGL